MAEPVFLLPLLPQCRLGSAVDTLVILNLRAAVAVVTFLEAVIKQTQVFLCFLGLINWVRIQNLEKPKKKKQGNVCYSE